jgi:hypothetical protein
MRQKEPVQPKAVAPRFEATYDHRIVAELRSRLASQVRSEGKESLTIAGVHAMHFDFLGHWLPTRDNPG